MLFFLTEADGWTIWREVCDYVKRCWFLNPTSHQSEMNSSPFTCSVANKTLQSALLSPTYSVFYIYEYLGHISDFRLYLRF